MCYGIANKLQDITRQLSSIFFNNKPINNLLFCIYINWKNTETDIKALILLLIVSDAKSSDTRNFKVKIYPWKIVLGWTQVLLLYRMYSIKNNFIALIHRPVGTPNKWWCSICGPLNSFPLLSAIADCLYVMMLSNVFLVKLTFSTWTCKMRLNVAKENYLLCNVVVKME